MEDIKQKRLAFLDDTAGFYNSNNRCVTDAGGCRYYLKGKSGCAIGRHIEDKKLCQEFDSNFEFMTGVSDESIFEKLPDDLKELGVGFLAQIQILHDIRSNWDENGLSEMGNQKYESIKNEYCQ